ncbi:MAG: dethiobiotin synthase [Methylococcales bacterium]
MEKILRRLPENRGLSDDNAYFVTGTDTGVGKTWVTLGLMEYKKRQGYRVAGMKPVASGAKRYSNALRNDDAVKIQRQCSIELPYRTVNPYAFEPPVPPHIAASLAGIIISVEEIQKICQRIREQVDCVFVEGVGGWDVPLNKDFAVSDLAKLLNIPVILVVGLRLGCLNHASLTYKAIKSSGAVCAGWVANQVDSEYLYIDENIATLKDFFCAPLLGFVPFMQEPDIAFIASCFETDARRSL